MIAQREKEIIEAREDARLAEEECHRANAALSEALTQKVIATKIDPIVFITCCLNHSYHWFIISLFCFIFTLDSIVQAGTKTEEGEIVTCCFNVNTTLDGNYSTTS